VSPLAVADPVAETEQPANAGTLPEGPSYLNESSLPAIDAVSVPESVMLLTAGEVNKVAGPETMLPV
jgi:hypothetical protein